MVCLAPHSRIHLSPILTVYPRTLYLFHLSLCIFPPPSSLITRTHTVAGGPDLLRAITPLLVTYRVFHGGRYRKKDKRKEKATQIDCAAAQWRRDILYVCNWTRVCRGLNNAKPPFRVYGWEFAWGSSVRLQEGSMIDYRSANLHSRIPLRTYRDRCAWFIQNLPGIEIKKWNGHNHYSRLYLIRQFRFCVRFNFFLFLFFS